MAPGQSQFAAGGLAPRAIDRPGGVHARQYRADGQLRAIGLMQLFDDELGDRHHAPAGACATRARSSHR